MDTKFSVLFQVLHGIAWILDGSMIAIAFGRGLVFGYERSFR
jgi:hypothetical protein